MDAADISWIDPILQGVALAALVFAGLARACRRRSLAYFLLQYSAVAALLYIARNW